MDVLYSIDREILLFFNQTLRNPVGDWFWPWLTEFDRHWYMRVLIVGIWLWLIVKGGRKGRTAAVLIVVVIIACDQLSSNFLKSAVGRLRPCHTVDGVTIVQGLYTPLDCGPGLSFPSSHAVNNFGMATLFSYFYPKIKWWLFAWASLVSLSRLGVGVHYPSDIAGGAIIGILVAAMVLALWLVIERRFFPISPPELQQ
jgi:undecaprenyl-diphosphatase